MALLSRACCSFLLGLDTENDSHLRNDAVDHLSEQSILIRKIKGFADSRSGRGGGLVMERIIGL